MFALYAVSTGQTVAGWESWKTKPEKFENIARAGEFKTDLPSGISAKERREEFLRKANETSIVKKEPTKIDINAAESGIYENEPARRDDVVRYDDEKRETIPTTVKWASEAKNRFIQEASKAQERIQRAQVSVSYGFALFLIYCTQALPY
ncbi:hypothetical protein FGIG_03615 [Fasciola gigantica]|uniref:Uncharacterized protein n=1 Tax=Fasciola gigantica TaxID=46835 RepID=A0A504Y9E1_FASGI|nr:hypothetical protein FGIG_03615 [Fasciola gigantica]